MSAPTHVSKSEATVQRYKRDGKLPNSRTGEGPRPQRSCGRCGSWSARCMPGTSRHVGDAEHDTGADQRERAEQGEDHRPPQGLR